MAKVKVTYACHKCTTQKIVIEDGVEAVSEKKIEHEGCDGSFHPIDFVEVE